MHNVPTCTSTCTLKLKQVDVSLLKDVEATVIIRCKNLKPVLTGHESSLVQCSFVYA